MRGFEMMPHPQMNLEQSLLLCACIAHFWKVSYTGELVRWGTRLQDKFMPRHHIHEDFQDVLHALKSGGYGFNPEWFTLFFASRFSERGMVQIGEVTLSIHLALEPWPVMGEEPSSGGTSRSLDVSVERVQIKAASLIEGRHMALVMDGMCQPSLACRSQECASRRGDSPIVCIRNYLPINAPLVFDLIDASQSRSLGAFTSRVSHSVGRAHDTSLPVNENEVEG